MGQQMKEGETFSVAVFSKTIKVTKLSYGHAAETDDLSANGARFTDAIGELLLKLYQKEHGKEYAVNPVIGANNVPFCLGDHCASVSRISEGYKASTLPPDRVESIIGDSPAHALGRLAIEIATSA